MNREIKFRLWDAKREEMHNDVPVRDLGSLNEQFEDNLHYKIWMQYVGIKDRAGNEIFEGDILENKVYGGRWQVCSPRKDWDYCGFVLRAPSGMDDLIYFKDKKNLEVIGNIHQNPELFK